MAVFVSPLLLIVSSLKELVIQALEREPIRYIISSNAQLCLNKEQCFVDSPVLSSLLVLNSSIVAF